jgi:ribose-phosphate pyrophosphokinase
MESYAIFAGTGNPTLAQAIARELGAPLGAATVERFPDGEVSVRLEESVRAREVFVVQPTSRPVNDNLVELLAFADACRRAAASRITAVVPYFGYARADKRKGRRDPIGARMVADVLQASGVQHVVTLDVHTPQIEGFFSVPVDNLTAVPTLCGALKGRLPDDAVVVSPDLGAVGRATEYGGRLGLPTAIVHKRRKSGAEVEAVQVIGDVRGRACLLVDDMISTGGTIVEAMRALHAAGARDEVFVAATHGVFVEDARERLAAAGARAVIVTDSLPIAEAGGPVQVVTIAPLLATALRHLIHGESLRDLF